MKLQLEFIQNETLSLKWNVKKATFNPFFLKKRAVSKQIMALKPENCFALKMSKKNI